MSKKETLHCAVITPEEQFLDADATAVVIPAHDGEIGILVNRAPLLCELGIGVLRVDTVAEGQREFYVDGGFAQVLNNEVTILTERAAPGEALTRAKVQEELSKAQHMPAHDLEGVEARDKAIARAKTRLKVAAK